MHVGDKIETISYPKRVYIIVSEISKYTLFHDQSTCTIKLETLKQRDYPELSGWTQFEHMSRL